MKRIIAATAATMFCVYQAISEEFSLQPVQFTATMIVYLDVCKEIVPTPPDQILDIGRKIIGENNNEGFKAQVILYIMSNKNMMMAKLEKEMRKSWCKTTFTAMEKVGN